MLVKQYTLPGGKLPNMKMLNGSGSSVAQTKRSLNTLNSMIRSPDVANQNSLSLKKLSLNSPSATEKVSPAVHRKFKVVTTIKKATRQQDIEDSNTVSKLTI